MPMSATTATDASITGTWRRPPGVSASIIAKALADALHVRDADILVNNAGIATRGYRRSPWVMSWATIWITMITMMAAMSHDGLSHE